MSTKTKVKDNIKRIMHLKNVSRFFGSVVALSGVSINVYSGKVTCLLGDNGAGKSTLIKTLCGVHEPSKGEILVDGKPVVFTSPRNALDQGIATVYQDLALVPLMSIARNFFMGRELRKSFGPFSKIDFMESNRIAKEQMQRVGINIRSASQAVGTLSGGERQCLAIARALYFGSKVLIFDEPTAALGVKQSSIVLDLIMQASREGKGVIFITHNAAHAHKVGDYFTILNRGRTVGNWQKKEITQDKLYDYMAGKYRADGE